MALMRCAARAAVVRASPPVIPACSLLFSQSFTADAMHAAPILMRAGAANLRASSNSLRYSIASHAVTCRPSSSHAYAAAGNRAESFLTGTGGGAAGERQRRRGGGWTWPGSVGAAARTGSQSITVGGAGGEYVGAIAVRRLTIYATPGLRAGHRPFATATLSTGPASAAAAPAILGSMRPFSSASEPSRSETSKDKATAEGTPEQSAAGGKEGGSWFSRLVRPRSTSAAPASGTEDGAEASAAAAANASGEAGAPDAGSTSPRRPPGRLSRLFEDAKDVLAVTFGVERKRNVEAEYDAGTHGARVADDVAAVPADE